MLSILRTDKANVAVVGASVAGIAVSWYSIWQSHRRVREQQQCKFGGDVTEGCNLTESRMDFIRRTTCMCVTANMGILKQTINELLNTTEAVAELKSMQAQSQVAIKLALWEQLKLRTFVRCVVSLYTVVLCGTFLLVYSTIYFAVAWAEMAVHPGAKQRDTNILQRLTSWNESAFRPALLAFVRHFAELATNRVSSHVSKISLKDTLSFTDATQLLETLHNAILREDNTISSDADWRNEVISIFQTSLHDALSEAKSKSKSLSMSTLFSDRVHEELNELLESREFAGVLRGTYQVASRRFGELLVEPFLASARSRSDDAPATESVLRVPLAKLVPLVANATCEIFTNEDCSDDLAASTSNLSLMREVLETPIISRFSHNVFNAFYGSI